MCGNILMEKQTLKLNNTHFKWFHFIIDCLLDISRVLQQTKVQFWADIHNHLNQCYRLPQTEPTQELTKCEEVG